jgi:hypothetical protein
MAWHGMTPEQHFRSRYRVDAATGCWLWIVRGSTPKNWPKYNPQIMIDGVTRRATHVSLELAGRPLPPGMFACHHCDTPLCVNPHHLFHGTQKDNIQDAMKKGRFPQAVVKDGFDWTGRKHTPETREKMRLVALKREAAKRNARDSPPRF